MEQKFLIAVYGCLRKGLSMHGYLSSNSVYIGMYDTDPIYDMYSIKSFPGLVKRGNTSIRMEVYEITEGVLDNIDGLEGVSSIHDDLSMFLRELVETPYGDAYIYFYNEEVKNRVKVDCGDWVEFKKELKKMIKI
jgi:gamma-glutamylcyclotransferase (GGCT)/AIG2-like uncharacterized protein YtfP